MALAELDTRSVRAGYESYDNPQERRKAKSQALRLTRVEAEELAYFFVGAGAELGCRSMQGAIESALMRSPPREDVRRYVLEELARLGGRACEGRLVAILCHDHVRCNENRSATKYEAMRAIRHLAAKGVLSRVAKPKPTATVAEGAETPRDLTRAEREWTGYEVRLTEDAPPSRFVPVDRAARWQAQDEALMREWHTMRLSGRDGGRKEYEVENHWDTTLSSAVVSSLERVSTQSAAVLRAVYGTSQRSVFDPVYGSELHVILHMTPSVGRARQDAAEKLAATRKSATLTRLQVLLSALREVRAVDVLRALESDSEFVARVKQEAETLLIRACTEYRKARKEVRTDG